MPYPGRPGGGGGGFCQGGLYPTLVSSLLFLCIFLIFLHIVMHIRILLEDFILTCKPKWLGVIIFCFSKTVV